MTRAPMTRSPTTRAPMTRAAIAHRTLASRKPMTRPKTAPREVQKAVLRLALALVELLRKIMERQVLRRMDEGTLTPGELERVGLALRRLEQTVGSLAARFGLSRRSLNLELGPLGRLW